MAGFVGMSSIARIAPGVSLDALRAAMTARSPAIGQAAAPTRPYSAAPGPFYLVATPLSQGTLFLILFGSACLWPIACANVASLELIERGSAGSNIRRPIGAGGIRAALARVAVVEGAWLIGGAWRSRLALAGGTQSPADTASRWPSGSLPESLSISTGVQWRFSRAGRGDVGCPSLPIVAFASRARDGELLKIEGRGSALSRGGSRGRRALTVVEVALGGTADRRRRSLREELPGAPRG